MHFLLTSDIVKYRIALLTFENSPNWPSGGCCCRSPLRISPVAASHREDSRIPESEAFSGLPPVSHAGLAQFCAVKSPRAVDIHRAREDRQPASEQRRTNINAAKNWARFLPPGSSAIPLSNAEDRRDMRPYLKACG